MTDLKLTEELMDQIPNCRKIKEFTFTGGIYKVTYEDGNGLVKTVDISSDQL